MRVEALPTLERERVEVFLRRPGGALSLTRLLMPEELAITLPHLGSILLRPSCSVIGAGAWPGWVDSCEVFALDATEGGALLVERNFAQHLVNAMVGLPASLVGRPLSRIERGMVTGLAALSLAKLGLPFGVRAVAVCGLPRMAEGSLCIHISAQLHGAEGQAWLCANAAAFETAWQTLGIAAPPASLRVELARTKLSKAAVIAACPQDLVVFDDSPACATSASLSVDISCRGRRLPARLDRNGRVRIDEAATCRIRPPRTCHLAADSVEVTAEIAYMRDSPAVSPSAGADWLLLRVGESDWAEGALAAYQDRLAVRINRILTRTCAG